MVHRHRTLAVLLSAAMATPAGAATDCAQLVGQLRGEAQAFQAEAERQGLTAALDASLDPALDRARKGLVQAGGPHAETLAELKDAKEKLQNFSQRVGSLAEFLSALSACLHGGPAGCLSQLAASASAENLAYVQGLAGESSAAAAARVEKAASFLNDYASRLNGSAQGSALSASSCMDERIQRLAQSGSGPADVPPAASTAASAPPPPDVQPRKGGGGGKALAVVLGSLGLAVGAVAVAKGAKAAGKCDAGYVYCQSPGGGGADVCCPAATPYYCKNDNGCRSGVNFSCPTGKIFCSTEY